MLIKYNISWQIATNSFVSLASFGTHGKHSEWHLIRII